MTDESRPFARLPQSRWLFPLRRAGHGAANGSPRPARGFLIVASPLCMQSRAPVTYAGWRFVGLTLGPVGTAPRVCVALANRGAGPPQSVRFGRRRPQASALEEPIDPQRAPGDGSGRSRKAASVPRGARWQQCLVLPTSEGNHDDTQRHPPGVEMTAGRGSLWVRGPGRSSRRTAVSAGSDGRRWQIMHTCSSSSLART